MLRGIRKASSNWVGKAIMAAVMGLLIFSFAIWGIGDIFRGFGMSTVAKIGNTEISIEQFRQIYNDRLQQLGRQIGKPISQDQARALGLDRQVLGQVLAETALDEQARKLHLGISDAEIAQRITQDPTFKGPNGQFDRTRFEAILRQVGYTETRFVAEQRQATLRRQIADTVVSGLNPPNVAVDALNRYQNEQRTIDYVVLGPPQAGEIAAPTPEELSAYFDKNKILFRAPEYRKVVFLTISPATAAKTVEVSDEDAKQNYDQHHDRYVTPEKREVQQIVFPTAEEAQAASEQIAKGETFAQIAAARKLDDKDINLGTVAKSGIIDSAIADAAFALKEGDVSPPIKGSFGTALIHVVKIEPGSEKPFSEVAPEIKNAIALERGKSQILNLHDKIEDDRAAGTSLAEIAQKMKVESNTIEAVDRSGRGPDGKPVTGLPKGVDGLAAAFASDVGVDNNELQTPDGGFVWYDVASITPSRDRTLDEVKDDVAKRWHDEQVATKLKAKAKEAADKLKAGAKIGEIAAAEQVEAKSATGLKRNAQAAVPAGVVQQAFLTAKGEASSAEGASPTEWYVFQTSEITVPNLVSTSPDAKRMQDAWRSSMSDGLLSEYVARLESDLGADINQAALAQIIGGNSTR